MINLREETNVANKINQTQYEAFKNEIMPRYQRILPRFLVTSLAIFIIISFLPWTQNIRSKGYVIPLKPEQRPQAIPALIAGRIEKWYKQEGDFVKKGDTIVFLSEIKAEYMDTMLLDRTLQQVATKESGVLSYQSKIQALDRQIDAMLDAKRIKTLQALNYIKQTKLKIQADSVTFVAAQTDQKIALAQLKRTEELYKDGLKPLTELEAKRQKAQETESKTIAAESKLLSSQNELLNTQAQIKGIEYEYSDKISKSESDKFSALSDMYEAENSVTKLQNQFANYKVRSGMYHITAPQDGYLTQAIKVGVGETIKEGEDLVTIMPADYNYAVELYVAPIDVPLINKNQSVRFIFDGFPAFLFAGWPKASFGIFSGKVVAIDNFISTNGKYRLLVAADTTYRHWPQNLRIGTGAQGFALLNNVPIWYEIWRRINGFPAEFYTNPSNQPQDSKDKEDKPTNKKEEDKPKTGKPLIKSKY